MKLTNTNALHLKPGLRYYLYPEKLHDYKYKQNLPGNKS